MISDRIITGCGVYAKMIAGGWRWSVLGVILVLLWGKPLLVFSADEAENTALPPEIPLKTASDSVVEKRLRTVIDNIDDFQEVTIEVNDGVVRLLGKTPRMEASEKVAQMVSRFEGVVYVDNQVQVETDIETRVKPAFTKVKQYLTNTVQKLPIFGVALLVINLFWLMAHFQILAENYRQGVADG